MKKGLKLAALLTSAAIGAFGVAAIGVRIRNYNAKSEYNEGYNYGLTLAVDFLSDLQQDAGANANYLNQKIDANELIESSMESRRFMNEDFKQGFKEAVDKVVSSANEIGIEKTLDQLKTP